MRNPTMGRLGEVGGSEVTRMAASFRHSVAALHVAQQQGAWVVETCCCVDGGGCGEEVRGRVVLRVKRRGGAMMAAARVAEARTEVGGEPDGDALAVWT